MFEMCDRAKSVKGLRQHEGVSHGNFEEYIDYRKEEQYDKPFRCMKCNHNSKTKMEIAKHLFIKHASAVITRIGKILLAKQAKEAELKAADQAAPRRQTRREADSIYRQNMADLHEKNQTLENINGQTDQIISHLEGKAETQQQERAADQHMIKESDKKLDDLAMILKSSIKDTGELQQRIKELEKSLKWKEEIDDKIIATQAAKLIKRKNRGSRYKQKLKLRKQQQQ